MKPSRSREVFGPGIGGANTNIESCDVEADCAVCGRHFAAYTGMQNWPYKLDQSDLPGGAGLFRRMCCSWSCLCRWRREHPPKAEKEDVVTVPLPEDFVVVGNVVTNFDRWKLIAIRAERELCRTTLAKLSGVSAITIAQIERDKNLPRPETVRKLAAAFGVEPKELLKD